MRTWIKEFKKGTFILEFTDEDLLFESIYARLVRYPNFITLTYGSENWVINDVYNKYIKIPDPLDMDDDEVIDLMKNVSVSVIDDRASDYKEFPVRYSLNYFYESIDPITFVDELGINYGLQLSEDDLHKVFEVSLPGLKMRAIVTKSLNVRMYSTFHFFGNHGQAKWFLKVLNRYLGLKRKKNDQKSR